MTDRLKVICCSCGISLGEKECAPQMAGHVSHGFCEPCSRHFLAQVGMPLSDYLEDIPAPVIAITQDRKVGCANPQALELLGKRIADVQGWNPGDVFECENAQSPEGCGNTIHCSGCAIRMAIEDTQLTGFSRHRVPAVLNQKSDRRKRRYELLISTEKKGGVVFLRIESADVIEVV